MTLKPHWRRMRHLSCAALILLACGCRMPAEPAPKWRDGRVHGVTQGPFLHRWWHHYERGLSFAEGGFLDEALADLRAAAGELGVDQRMARTYGMHFMDYFPHREMGVIHFQRHDLDAAEREFLLSLSQQPSAKARYYLDRVRRSRLLESGAGKAPPRLILDDPEDMIWTREDAVTVSGTAADDAFVAEVRVDGRAIPMAAAEETVRFSESLRLEEGRHEIVVEAVNLVGGRTEIRRVVQVDREGPVIAVTGLERRDGVSLAQVWIGDEAGVARARIGAASVEGGLAPELVRQVPLPDAGEGLRIIATDRLGNETTAVISGNPSLARPSGALLFAEAGGGSAPRSFLGMSPADTTPPEIVLAGWTSRQTVYMDRAYLAGAVRDAGGVREVRVNGTVVTRARGLQVFFGHMATLAEGVNALTIDAEDLAGNQTHHVLTIERKLPAAFAPEQRLSLSVLPFFGPERETAESFEALFTAALFHSRRFRMVERQRLASLLEEQGLSRSRLADPDTAIELGRLLAAQSVVAGDMVPGIGGTEIVARVIDTETGDILAVEDVYRDAAAPPGLRETADGLAALLHRDFPLTAGGVLKREGRVVFSDLGTGDIAPRRRVLVFREIPVVHPVTGQLLGADSQILALCRVAQVFPGMSKAEIQEGDPQGITLTDRMVAQ